MIKKITSIIIINIVLISGIATAQDEPINPPPGFYGTLTINGQPAPSGTTIIAKIAGETRGSLTTFKPGLFGDNPGPSKLWITAYQNEIGSTVTFYVNDIAARQTSTLAGAGTLNGVGLTFIVPVSGTGGSPGGGGVLSGGGGGGITSGENSSNIELRESYDLEIFKDILTSYRFTHTLNPIRFINITGNVNGGVITTSVEVLKGTSSIVTSDAPGVVYKNVNIWVGLKDFATQVNIKEAKIVFKVDTSWLTDNKISGNQLKLLKWDGSKWVTLDTSEIRKDATTTYFESVTDSFSMFAISGIMEIASTPTPSVTQTPIPGITGAAVPPVKAPIIQNWILVVIIAAAYFFIIKKK